MDKCVQVLAPGGGAPLSITGSADDFGVVGAIERAGGNYEPQVMHLLGRAVRRADTCLDIGANIGILTLALARLAPDGRVFAFEPGDTSYAYLTRNVADNDAANTVTEQLGAYDVTGTLTLQTSASHPGGAYIADTDAHESASERVPVTRLDDWVDRRGLDRVDVIKMDIEGAELRALAGAQKTLGRFHPFLVVECNPVALKRFQNADANALVDALRSMYGKVFFIDGFDVRELVSAEQAQRALELHGIIDLVCGDRARELAITTNAAGTARRARAIAGRLRRAATRRFRPADAKSPVLNFVHDPSYEARFSINRLVATKKTTVVLPVSVRNTGHEWFSSTFPNHPICASYHWRSADGALAEADGIRTFFRDPLGPGESTVLDLVVAIPEQVGEFTLEFALVQEAFAWFDDLRPELTLRLPVIVR